MTNLYVGNLSPDTTTTHLAPSTDPAELLRCAACGRTAACAKSDLICYGQTNWPHCCGDAMTLFLPAEWGEGTQPWSR